MTDLKPKVQPKPEVAVEPETKAAAPVTAPIEVSCQNRGIAVTIEGDFVTIDMTAYITDHIGAYRNHDRVQIKFKHGGSTDITAYKDG